MIEKRYELHPREDSDNHIELQDFRRTPDDGEARIELTMVGNAVSGAAYDESDKAPVAQHR